MATSLQLDLLRMSGRDAAHRLARLRAFRPGAEAPATPACLDDDTLAAFADGTITAAGRSAGLPHLAHCDRCRRAVVSITRALAHPVIAREVGGGPRWLRAPWRLAIGAAAAAALAVLVWPSPPEQAGPHRAAPITAAPAPAALAPVGRVSEARTLSWSPVAGADRYRVTLFAADGRVRFETEVVATEVALPDSVLPVAGETFWWQVAARLGFDRWASSGLIEASLPPGPRP